MKKLFDKRPSRCYINSEGEMKRQPTVGISLAEQHIGLARGLARKMRAGLPQSVPLEDAEQEAVLQMLECQSSYDPQKGPFSAYAKVAIRRRLGRLAEAEVSLRRERSARAMSLCEPAGASADGATDPHCDESLDHADPSDEWRGAAASERLGDSGPLRRVVCALPATERDLVLAIYGEDLTLEEAAGGGTRARKRAHKQRARALARMRGQLEPTVPRRVAEDCYMPPRRIFVPLHPLQWADRVSRAKQRDWPTPDMETREPGAPWWAWRTRVAPRAKLKPLFGPEYRSKAAGGVL